MTSRTLAPLVVLVMHVVALPDVARAASEGQHDEPTISIRIHDYAGVPQQPLSRAQVVVSSMFERIGVRTEWLDAVRPSEWTPFDQRPAAEIERLTLIVLTPDMVSRKEVPDAVMGFAAVGPGQIGRVAYVIYDRVVHIARMSAARDWQLMGMVMAHEIGHLLMAPGSHSRDGLMREAWDRKELKRFDKGDFSFSASQGTEIRRALADGLPDAP
jgi:hypothetical protein